MVTIRGALILVKWEAEIEVRPSPFESSFRERLLPFPRITARGEATCFPINRAFNAHTIRSLINADYPDR